MRSMPRARCRPAIAMKPGREAALRDERGRSALGKAHHLLGDGDVLGEVEVVDARSLGLRGDAGIAVERCAGEDRPASRERRDKRVRIGDVRLHAIDLGAIRREPFERLGARIDHPHAIVAAGREEVSSHAADPARSDHQHLFHASLLSAAFPTGRGRRHVRLRSLAPCPVQAGGRGYRPDLPQRFSRGVSECEFATGGLVWAWTSHRQGPRTARWLRSGAARRVRGPQVGVRSVGCAVRRMCRGPRASRPPGAFRLVGRTAGQRPAVHRLVCDRSVVQFAACAVDRGRLARPAHFDSLVARRARGPRSTGWCAIGRLCSSPHVPWTAGVSPAGA